VRTAHGVTVCWTNGQADGMHKMPAALLLPLWGENRRDRPLRTFFDARTWVFRKAVRLDGGRVIYLNLSLPVDPLARCSIETPPIAKYGSLVFGLCQLASLNLRLFLGRGLSLPFTALSIIYCPRFVAHNLSLSFSFTSLQDKS
jgi:hypothetical protein